MYNLLERVVPFIWVVLACTIMAFVWTVWFNRHLRVLIFGKPKSIKKWRGRGTELIRASGTVSIGTYDKQPHLLFQADGLLVLLDTITNFGRFDETKINEATILYKDGQAKYICFDKQALNDAVHKSFIKQAQYVFITVGGVYILWSMLSKM